MLAEILRDKTGIALGEFKPQGLPLVSIPGKNSEEILDSVMPLDFVLMDANVFFFESIETILQKLPSKLKQHGLICLFADKDASEPFKYVQKILVSGPYEFLFEEGVDGGTCYGIRLIKELPARATKLSLSLEPNMPLRYRIADKANELVSFLPAMKRMLKKVFS